MNAAPAGVDVLGVDSTTLLPSLIFKQEQTLNGESVPIAWQAGFPLTSFDPQDRPRLSLAGIWKKERVQLNTDLSLSGRGPQGLGEIEAEAEGRFLPEFDDRAWDEKELPGVENVIINRGPEKYEGGVWYRRSFSIPADWQGSRITFNALAINYVADIWVNGTWVGYHEGGYTPFALDISTALNYESENNIAIRVDNPPWGSRADIVPGVTPDWWNYTGIIQDIYLEAAPPLWIVRADVQTPDTSGQVLVDILLYNAGNQTQKGELTLQLYDTDPQSVGWLTNPSANAIKSQAIGDPRRIKVKVSPGQAFVLPAIAFNIPNPQLWSPENPALYVLGARLTAGRITDSFMTQFGIRTLETKGHHLLLNGKPYFLAGIARHEEWPDSGRTANWNKIRQDLELIQAQNANFIRTAHYPNHVYTYILTDRLGLLAAEEIPVWQYDTEEFNAQAERRIADQMWREMILTGSNRPSIIIWSMQNESQDVPARSEYIKRLHADFHQNLSDGRLLIQSAAADRGGPKDHTQEYLNIAGWTMYFGVFYGENYAKDSATFLQQAHMAYPNKPLLNTEYGVWSQGGNSSTVRQVELFSALFETFSQVTSWDTTGSVNPDGYLGGITWWAMFDWYTAHTFEQTMGLYKMDRNTAKPVAKELQEAYQRFYSTSGDD